MNDKVPFPVAHLAQNRKHEQKKKIQNKVMNIWVGVPSNAYWSAGYWLKS